MDNRSSTTFILGAGASSHAGYPFVKLMGAELLAWMRLPREEVHYDFAATADAIEEEFGDDIESICNGIANPKPGYLLRADKPCLLEAVRRWFADIQRDHQADAYDRFATHIVRPRDTVVTFNYDVSLDLKMRQSGKWSMGDGYGFIAEGLPNNSVVQLLKLHGSINWLGSLFGGRTGYAALSGGAFGSRPFVISDDRAAGLAGVLPARLAGYTPLILPTSHKDFFLQSILGREWEEFWKALWREARKAIETSDRVVICGYGMYPIDEAGRNLLLKGELRGKFEVCCGGDSARIVQELRDHGRSAHHAEQTFFEEWVAAQ